MPSHSSSRAAMPTRHWFQPGDGISREVITADIPRYLGPDALVRPGRGTGEHEGVDGYWITAYRPLTSQMVMDLRTDSARWRTEAHGGRGSPHVRDSKVSRHPDTSLVAYQDSQTHHSRQYYGPTSSSSSEASYATHQPSQPVAAYGSGYEQPTHRSSPQVNYQDPASAYTYGQPQAQSSYAQQGGQYVAPQGYSQQVPRTAQPAYGYPPTTGQSDPYARQEPTRDARYASSAAPPSRQDPRDTYAATQTPSTPQYYQASDGRTYSYAQAPQPPSSSSHGRRR